jgi:hypothetical protein
MRALIIIICSCLILTGCRKDEELRTGNISGKISSYDQFGFPKSEQTGISVDLYRDSALISTVTADYLARYVFNDIPYGKYHISYHKENLIQTQEEHVVYHAGGGASTISNFSLFEIPTYQLDLDSVGFPSPYLYIYLKYNNSPNLPWYFYGLPCRAFFGNSAEVSKDNYLACSHISSITHEGSYDNPGKAALWVEIWGIKGDMDQLKQGTTWVRVYPIAIAQGYDAFEFYPEALGPPSDAVSFKWP